MNFVATRLRARINPKNLLILLLIDMESRTSGGVPIWYFTLLLNTVECIILGLLPLWGGIDNGLKIQFQRLLFCICSGFERVSLSRITALSQRGIWGMVEAGRNWCMLSLWSVSSERLSWLPSRYLRRCRIWSSSFFSLLQIPLSNCFFPVSDGAEKDHPYLLLHNCSWILNCLEKTTNISFYVLFTLNLFPL